MSGYLLTWITGNLAVGHAPLSWDDLDSIREQGIDAIVNLCEEFCDLHELEEQAGFEVFYLPITDEHAPKMEEMETGLAWMDEAIYLGKKVLVHCKHGVGRTGTFVTAYLLRRGFGMRKAEKILRKRKTRANPTNFSQWWLLRKYGKQEGKLKIGEATADNRGGSADLSEFYARYEQLLRRTDAIIGGSNIEGAGGVSRTFCSISFSLAPIEAIYLNDRVNRRLSAEKRKEAITRAVELLENGGDGEEEATGTTCPLYGDDGCILHQYRPLRCRTNNMVFNEQQLDEVSEELSHLTRDIFQTLFQKEFQKTPPSVNHLEVISGKFIERYFQFLASQRRNS